MLISKCAARSSARTSRRPCNRTTIAMSRSTRFITDKIIHAPSRSGSFFFPQARLVIGVFAWSATLLSANTRAVILMFLLQVTGLCKTFGEVRAASDVCFEVRAGEIYGLLGPNGAGKTTTISMISGLLRPDAGQVVIAGTPFGSDPQRAKRIMGVV